MDPLNPPRLPDVDNLELYIENRTQLLRQAYDNYAVWEAQLALAKRDVTGYRWIDMDGTARVVMITEPFLKTHWKMIRSLILDLVDCGRKGRLELRRIVVEKTGKEFIPVAGENGVAE